MPRGRDAPYDANMLKRLLVTVLCGFIASTGLALATTTSQASAAPACSDVAAVFARGTAEPAPPLGITGVSFVEALRSQLPGRSLSVTGVNYAASANFGNRVAFGASVINGVRVTQDKIKSIARTCPRTRIVVGGYSQGAVVAQYAVSPGITLPASYGRFARDVPPPLPAAVARNVAAVVLFATPSARFLRDAGAPVVQVSPQYQAKTIRYCIAGDNICNGARLAGPSALHVLYSVNGDTLNAARRVVGRL